MDLTWKLQQENAGLRKKVAVLELQVAALTKVEAEKKPTSRIFTDGQLEFIREHDMNYSEVYRLAKKYDSGTDAIADLVEG